MRPIGLVLLEWFGMSMKEFGILIINKMHHKVCFLFIKLQPYAGNHYQGSIKRKMPWAR